MKRLNLIKPLEESYFHCLKLHTMTASASCAQLWTGKQLNIRSIAHNRIFFENLNTNSKKLNRIVLTELCIGCICAPTKLFFAQKCGILPKSSQCIFVYFFPLETIILFKYYLLFISGFLKSILIQPVYNDAEDSATGGAF